MGCDPFSPVSLVQINVVCLPAARISRENFNACLAALKARPLVRLRHSAGPPSKEGKSMENIEAVYITGTGAWLLFNISDSYTYNEYPELFPLETNRGSQIILGIIPGDNEQPSIDNGDLPATLSEFQQRTASYEYAITRSIVRWGGPKTADADDCYWIDSSESDSAGHEFLMVLGENLRTSLPAYMEKIRSRFSDFVSQSTASHRASMSTHDSTRINSPSIAGDRQRDAVPSVHDLAARQSITFGIIHLQAGQWSLALRFLSEGAAGTRSAGDHIWHARALEGLLTCMLMLTWARLDFSIPQICYPSNDKHSQIYYSRSMTDIMAFNRATSVSLFGSTSAGPTHALTELLPHLISTIIGLYERATNAIDSTFPSCLLCETRLRWYNLLVAMIAHGSSLSQSTLQSLVNGAAGNAAQDAQGSPNSMLVLQKTALTQLLVDVANEAIVKLDVEESVMIQFAITRSFFVLGVERKQGFHLKQFLQRFASVLAEARRKGAAEVGVHPSANLPELQVKGDGQNSLSRNGIHAMLNIVAEVYGLPIASRPAHRPTLLPLQRLEEALRFWSVVQNSGDIFIKLEVLSLCIEICDAVPDPESSLSFTSCLLQASKKSVTISSVRADDTPLIASANLSRLLHNIQRSISAAERFGMSGLRADYWDKFLVRNIELLEESSSNKLMPHTAQDLSIAASNDNDVKKDPFIFNPFAKPKTRQGELVVAVGLPVNFSVMLQNPLDCEIEIESIQLLTEGAKFKPTEHSIVLGPLCSQVFIVNGVSEETGHATITGCRAMIKGCYAEDFLILPAEWRLPLQTKLGQRHNTSTTDQKIDLPTAKQLRLKIIEHLPVLSLASTSLLQSSLMLLEGETKQFEIILRNDSQVDIDFVTVTFDDTITKRLEDALGSKDLSPADTYELQFQIANRPALKWLNEDAGLEIAAGSTAVFRLEVFGKPGLDQIHVLVDYACLGKPKSQVTETFYTRQLTYSLLTTVNGSIDIPRCMLIPLPEGGIDRALDSEMRALSLGDHDTNLEGKIELKQDSCLLLLDVRNVWPCPLTVEFSTTVPAEKASDISNPDQRPHTVSEIIQPGQITRMMLLIPRFFVDDAQAHIPNLDTRRQFVVSASKLSAEAEATNREIFWYRERLLEGLQARWKEQSGSRQGVIDLRKNVRLTQRMVDVVRKDAIEVSFSLRQDEEGQDKDEIDKPIVMSKGLQYSLVKDRFARLITSIHNRGQEELQLLLRLQPSLRDQAHNVALELSKRFIWSGSLQQAIHPPIKPGETRDVELSIFVLVSGHYEVTGMVEEIRRSTSSDQGGSPVPGLLTNRRIWHARQPCVIDVHDRASQIA